MGGRNLASRIPAISGGQPVDLADNHRLAKQDATGAERRHTLTGRHRRTRLHGRDHVSFELSSRQCSLYPGVDILILLDPVIRSSSDDPSPGFDRRDPSRTRYCLNPPPGTNRAVMFKVEDPRDFPRRMASSPFSLGLRVTSPTSFCRIVRARAESCPVRGASG